MRAKHFEDSLAQWTGYPAGEVDQRARGARELGFLSHVRGRHSPDIDPSGAAAMILSLISRRATDAAEVASRAMKLPLVPRGDDLADFAKDDFFRTLVTLLSAPNSWPNFVRLEIREDGSFARFELPGDAQIIYTDDSTLRSRVANNAQDYDHALTAICERRFIFGSAVLHQLAIDIADHEDARYSERGWAE